MQDAHISADIFLDSVSLNWLADNIQEIGRITGYAWQDMRDCAHDVAENHGYTYEEALFEQVEMSVHEADDVAEVVSDLLHLHHKTGPVLEAA